MSYDIFVTIIFFFFAVVMALQSIRLGLGEVNDPGSGFLPTFSSLSIAILSLLYLGSQIFKDKKKKKLLFELGPHWKRALYLTVLSFLYVLVLWDKLGYIISTTLWLVFVFWLAGVKPWTKTLMIAIAVVIASYFLFGKVAKCFLPRGILGF